MITGITKRLRQRYPGIKIALPINYYRHDPQNAKMMGFGICLVSHKYGNKLYHKLHRAGMRVLNGLAQLLPFALRNKMNVFSEKDISVVIDTSGFYLGDQWDAKRLINMVKIYARYKSAGKKLILPPKAYGPLSTADHQYVAKRLYALADFMVARDRVSHKMLSDAIGLGSNTLYLAPDFTLDVKPQVQQELKDYSGFVCIVPNNRFTEKKRQGYSGNYVEYMAELIEHILSKGKKVFIVVHTVSDSALAKQIASKLTSPVDCLAENNPLVVKKYIGMSSFAISSRYHGIMNAFSQNVPVVGTSWNHKYDEVYKEYGVPELLMNDFSDFEALKRVIGKLTDETEHARYVEKIHNRNIGVEKEIHAMWELIYKITD